MLKDFQHGFCTDNSLIPNLMLSPPHLDGIRRALKWFQMSVHSGFITKVY